MTWTKNILQSYSGENSISFSKNHFSRTYLSIAHSQREKQRLLAMLFSTSKYEKSKANVKLAKAKVEVLTLLLHSY